MYAMNANGVVGSPVRFFLIIGLNFLLQKRICENVVDKKSLYEIALHSFTFVNGIN